VIRSVKTKKKCEAVCPNGIPVKVIAETNRNDLEASFLHDARAAESGGDG
jgi:hypothetical protein